MDIEKFDNFAAMTMGELEFKQGWLQAEFSLNNWAKWWFRPETSTLQFENEHGQIVVEADTVYIGSYSTSTGTWKWAWSNPFMGAEDRAKSEKIRELTKVTGVDIFDLDTSMEGDEQLAYDFTAMAVHHLNADGFFRIPNKDPQTAFFLALHNVRHCGVGEQPGH